MVAGAARRSRSSRGGHESGFTLVELLMATAITVTVLGSTVMLARQVQQRYQAEMDAAAIRAEAQYALDWIVRDLRAAGANPYNVTVSNCPTTGNAFRAIRRDPNGDGVQNDIRVHADVNPPNGQIGGASGACIEANEDITISHDPVARVITRRDNNVGATALPTSDTVITGLTFTYLDAMRGVAAADTAVSFVQIAVTAEAPSRDLNTREPVAFTARDEVRVRVR